MSYAATIQTSLPALPSIPAREEHTGASTYDCELARRIASGDLQAFEEVYQRYHRRVYSVCLRMTSNVAEAEDLTQEVFIHVYHKISSFRGESALMTWLHRVTVNKTLMHFRSTKRRREKLAAEESGSESPSLEKSQAVPAPLLVDRLALERAIAKLSPGYRAVFTLHDIEGYDHNEIARICGMSVGTSKSQLHKARKRLRALLRATTNSVETATA
jgi:RNA polymerase sigma-70 factor, ECF subfamily